MVHGKRGLVEACYSFSCLDDAMECVVHGCDEKGLMLSEHTLIIATNKILKRTPYTPSGHC